MLRLDIEGFGPFRDRQVLDFARAAEGGLLLISGRTGAGKSSLLDAVSFALYGAVPRYDGQVSRVRSDHSAADRPTLVRLDFEVAGQRFRVERSPEYSRPAKRGGGTTLQKPEARLWRWSEPLASWEGLASRAVDVAALLGPVLRLTHEQFLQVVMLSQGGFQRFLRAADDERQTTLRTLFQTERFAAIEDSLFERRRVLDSSVRENEARIEGLLGGLEASLKRDAAATQPEDPAAGQHTLASRRATVARAVAALEASAVELEVVAEGAKARLLAATTELERARSLAALQDRLSRAESAQRELASKREQIDSLRAQLDSADRAARVDADRARYERTRSEASLAQTHWDSCLAALRAEQDFLALYAPDANTLTSAEWQDTSELLTSARDTIARQLGSLAEASEAETRLGTVTTEIARLNDTYTSQAGARDAEREALAALPALLQDLRDERENAAPEAAAVDQRDSERAQAATRLEAANQATALSADLRGAQQKSAEDAEATAAHSREVSRLLAKRIAGMAGELASSLIGGEPCSVCGSTSHPKPASHSDPVTPELIDAAELKQRRAQADLDSARAAERAIEAELAVARATAAQSTPEAASAELAAATTRLDAARSAVARLAETDAALAVAEDEVAARTARVRELDIELAALLASSETLGSEAKLLGAELVNARAGFSSLSERIERLETHHGRCEAALRAGDARSGALAAREEAKRGFDAALISQGFADPDSSDDEFSSAATRANDARLAADELQRLRAQVLDFDEATQRNAGELESPELQNIARDPVDVGPSAAAAETARQEADGALSAQAAAARIAEEYRSTLRLVEQELEASSAAGEELLQLRRLADTLQGKDPNTKRMRLEVFVLAARLEAIVAAANLRLATMVGGRYRLAHDDGLRARGRRSGLGLAVIDEYTGRTRSTDSLSGGESFLASLALALGLADVVTAESGGLQLDTLFIDEGFGSLDPDALDQALATLDGLREGGRTVALISHVAELKERLAGGLEVISDGQGVSTLRGDGVVDTAEMSPEENGNDTR